MQQYPALLVPGHDASWAPPDAVIDVCELPDGMPVVIVESDHPDLYQLATAAGHFPLAHMPRADLVMAYFDFVDPGRCSVRRDLLAACDAARGGTHAEKNAALDALLASVRD